MILEAKPIALIAGLGLFTLTALMDSSSEIKEPECKINVEELERKIDQRLIEQSRILGNTAVAKDSGVKQLTKVCSVLKTEVKTLRVENKELKSEVSQLASKPADTVVKTIFIKKGLFGKEDTLD